MLKRVVGGELWCITQPDHAAAAGYLAAHWGNDAFARPGYYAPFPEPERLRAETILAIAEHDNGWWEWEADPRIDPADGLPLDLASIGQSDGLERWRRGVPRFREEHPYVALLISLHAYWLHAPRVGVEEDPAFLHPLFGGPGDWPRPEGEELEEAGQFVGEQHVMQELLSDRLRSDPLWAAAVEHWHLRPHARLLQVCDALSLHLCFGGAEERVLAEIPRRNWDDRVSPRIRAVGERRVAIDPYPFDLEPLSVALRGRILAPGTRPATDFHSWWQAQSRQEIRFEFISAG
jgi:hypothetical protein